ncbi:MAG: HemK/PrmC family methyltransferase, partial [Candidatus Omnitrophota bacterium]
RTNNVRINFIQGDLFNTCHLQPPTYDLIVCNPPYIPTSEIDRLQPEISYEPRIALDGGRDGLNFYERIIRDAPSYLKKKGLLIMEMGINQGEGVENLLKNSGNFEIIEIVKDYSNIDRVMVSRRIGSV